MIKGYQGERLRQAFHYFDKDGDGYISPDEFQRIIIEIAGHKLSDSIMERLPTLCTMNPGRKISYSEVIAFHNIIREMDTVERIITHAVRKSRDGRIDLSDFLNEAAGSMRYGMFTPMEANIIWHFASRGGMGSNQRLGLNDFQALLDAKVRIKLFIALWVHPHLERRVGEMDQREICWDDQTAMPRPGDGAGQEPPCCISALPLLTDSGNPLIRSA